MSETKKSRHGRSWLVWLIVPGALYDFGLLIAYLLRGKNVALFNPQGSIAHEQHSLMLVTLAVIFTAAVPTILFLYFTAWKYRESNTKATHTPSAQHGKRFVFSIWAIPCAFLLILAPFMYLATHRLDPRKQIAADSKPMTIQVVATRWKWVFLYPEQEIATVNFVQIPKDTPVTFELTADEAPMSSFWIPNLGGQLYAMTGHVNRLNLMGDKVGDYPGSSAEINGAGFAGMKFTARVSSAEAFDLWTQGVKQSPDELNTTVYENLVKPSEDNPVTLYATFEHDLYDTVVMKYMGSHDHQTAHYEAGH